MDCRGHNVGERVRFFAALTCAGVIAGLTAVVMIVFLHACVWVFFGMWTPDFMTALAAASPARRMVAVPAGALLAGCAWAALRRREAVLGVAGLLKNVSGSQQNVSETMPPRGAGRLEARRLWQMVGCAFTQVAAVGAGNSIGRENAPRQMAAALTYWCGRRLGLSREHLTLTIAAAAGAALAGVYNTPVAAVAFTAGITLRKWSVRTCVASAWVAAIATPIAWLANHNLASMPLDLPLKAVLPEAFGHGVWGLIHAYVTGLAFTGEGRTLVLVCAVLAVVCGLAGVAMAAACRKAQAWAGERFTLVAGWRARGMMLAAMVGAGTLTGVLALRAPQILGNGKNTMDIAYGNAPALAGVSLGVALFVALAKPLATAVSLGSGMIGGLLMPSCALGGSLGVAASLIAASVGVDVPIALAALVGAACVLAVTQRCGIFAWVFLLELAHAPGWVWPLAALAVAVAVGCARSIGALRARA